MIRKQNNIQNKELNFTTKVDNTRDKIVDLIKTKHNNIINTYRKSKINLVSIFNLIFMPLKESIIHFVLNPISLTKNNKRTNRIIEILSWFFALIVLLIIDYKLFFIFFHDYFDFKWYEPFHVTIVSIIEYYTSGEAVKLEDFSLIILLQTLPKIYVFILIENFTKKIIRSLISIRRTQKTKKGLTKLKRQIKKTIYQLVKLKDEETNSEDEYLGEILEHTINEFDLEGVDEQTIQECINELAQVITRNEVITEIIALTDFKEKTWLTRRMLMYLFRTIQIASKINENDRNKKLRTFILKDGTNNRNLFAGINSLHQNFMHTLFINYNKIKELDLSNIEIEEKPAFLYLKSSDNGNEYTRFWHIKHVRQGKFIWQLTTFVPDDYSKIISFIKNKNGNGK